MIEVFAFIATIEHEEMKSRERVEKRLLLGHVLISSSIGTLPTTRIRGNMVLDDHLRTSIRLWSFDLLLFNILVFIIRATVVVVGHR